MLGVVVVARRVVLGAERFLAVFFAARLAGEAAFLRPAVQDAGLPLFFRAPLAFRFELAVRRLALARLRLAARPPAPVRLADAVRF